MAAGRQGDYSGVCARLEEQERLLRQLFGQQRQELNEQVRLLAEQLAPKSAPTVKEADTLARSKSRLYPRGAAQSSPEDTPASGSGSPQTNPKDTPTQGARSDPRTLKRATFNYEEASTVGRSRSRPVEIHEELPKPRRRPTMQLGRNRSSSLAMQHEEVAHVAEVLRRREKHSGDGPWEAVCGSEDSDESESEEAAGINITGLEQETIVPHNKVQAFLLPVVSSTWFQTLIGGVIVINAASLGFDLNRKIRAVDEHLEGPPPRATMELTFTVIFTIEMLLRLLAEQWDFFSGHNRHWNFFESFIVFCAWAEPLSFMQGTSSLRILRVLRIVRAVRLVRVFRFLHQLRLMLFSLLSCFLSMVWAILLLFLLMYLFSLYLEEVTLEYLSHHQDTDIAKELRMDWDGIITAMLSLIYSISGGKDWSALANPFMQIWWVHGCMYMLFVLFTTLGIFNILVGIFVAETERVAEWDKNLVVQEELMKQESTVQTLEEVFQSIDRDADNHISFDELSEALDDPEVNAYLSHLHIDTTTAGILFGLLDENKDKLISREEFVAGFLRLKGGAKPTELAVLMQHSGHILSRLDVLEQCVCNRIRLVEEALKAPACE